MRRGLLLLVVALVAVGYVERDHLPLDSFRKHKAEGAPGPSAGPAPAASPCVEAKPIVLPEKAGVGTAGLGQAQSLLRSSAPQLSPGGALAIGKGADMALLTGAGRLSPQGGAAVNAATTRYDLASLTKVVATTAAAMLLYQDGKLDLAAPAAHYWPELKGKPLEHTTITQLLTHTSGLPEVQIRANGPRAALAKLLDMPLSHPGRVTYTNLNMVVMWQVLGRILGKEPVETFLAERIWRPLGMCQTGFQPALPCQTCAPGSTDVEPGKVSDPTGASFNGITGCAGLFSTALDLGRYASLLASGGSLDGHEIFHSDVVAKFTAAQPGADTRALGWDTAGPSAPSPLSAKAYGHTGWTGTSMIIDPDSGAWAVVLTNYHLGNSSMKGLNALRRTAILAAES